MRQIVCNCLLAVQESIQKTTDVMRKLKHLMLIGEVAELREFYEEVNKLRKEFAVDVLFVPDAENSFLPECSYMYTHSAVMLYLDQHPELSHVCCSASVMRRDELAELFYTCQERGVKFSLLPIYIASLRRSMKVVQKGHVSLLQPKKEPLAKWYNRLLKRSFDLIVSLLVLLTVFPLVWVVQAIRVKHRGAGPVFLRQKHSGPDGRVFHRLTFNGKDAELGSRLVSMPQFINVFFGEMSLIGPSPRTASDIEAYFSEADRFHVLHWPKAGMTGWASVNSHEGQTLQHSALENEVSDDIWYVQNWTFALDLQILFRALI